MTTTAISWDRAFARLGDIRFDPRGIAQAFAIATGGRRVVYFPPSKDGGIAREGIDTRGTTITRLMPAAFEFHRDVVGDGPDGLCPIADRSPGIWMAVNLGAKAGGVAILQAAEKPSARFAGFCRAAAARIIAETERRLAQARAERDPLTGLLNREGLAASIADRTRYVIVSLDANGLKGINDTLGHGAGDTYLQAMGAALTASVRTHDPVARFGGDEFAVVVDTSDTVERIREHLASATWTLPGGEFGKLSASMGSARVPEDAAEFAAAYEIADQRMYAEKRAYHEKHGTGRTPNPPNHFTGATQ